METFPSPPPYFTPVEKDVNIYHIHTPFRPPLPPPPSFFSPGVIYEVNPAPYSPTFTPGYKVVRYEVKLRRSPGLATCPSCQVQVTSEVYYRVGTYAWLMCLLFVLCGMVLGCCLIPFFIRHFKDVYHTCPNCHRVLRVHRRACC